MGINLVTGGTGHLGISLIHWILERDNTVTLLVRSNSLKKFGGFHGIVRAVKSCGSDYPTDWIEQHINIVVGDIAKPRLGLAQREYQELSRKTTAIYHLAALLDLTAPWELLQDVNIEGTRHVLDFGLACVDRAEFLGLYHISTFAVAGTATGTFYETDLDCGQQFNNHYERSKFEAERLIAAYREKGLCISIFRPSIIVGDSRTGETRSFETLYKPLHFLSLGLFDQIPARGSTKLNLAPVDSVAEAIHRIVEKNEAKNLTYHLINNQEITCEFLIKVASR
ncbi:MAG TPA: SDR family oxidoreductase, partial [Nitrospiria bacterium]|nr:SDR family oxidoreductase [Nitrospiria bacterium]